MIDIYKNIETPCFVIDKFELDNNITSINEGRKVFKNSIIGYSVKTNSLRWLLEYFNNNTDFIFEVVSPDEYDYVSKIGINSKKIIYNGPCKNKESLEYALLNGSIVNIDTYPDLLNIEKINFPVSIGIRINVTNNTIEENINSFGYEESRFGFSYYNGDLDSIINRINSNKNIHISGLHFHLSNKKRDIQNYINIAKMATEIINKYNLRLDYIDFGGGYKGGVGNDFIEYTTAIKCNLNIPNRDNITYIFEPGASIIATPVSYLMKVIDVKEINNKNFVLVDGSRTQVDPTFSNKKYKYNIYSKSNNYIKNTQILNGFTCMENDRFMTLINSNELNIGDVIELNNLGAYTMTLSPCFIKGYPNVYLNDNGDLHKVREAQDLYEILGGDNGKVYRKVK